MYKKYFEEIADCIEYRLCAKDNHPHKIAERLADYFATRNKDFNRTRFLRACGLTLSEIEEALK
jgi:hypothetical protein